MIILIKETEPAKELLEGLMMTAEILAPPELQQQTEVPTNHLLGKPELITGPQQTNPEQIRKMDLVIPILEPIHEPILETVPTLLLTQTVVIQEAAILVHEAILQAPIEAVTRKEIGLQVQQDLILITPRPKESRTRVLEMGTAQTDKAQDKEVLVQIIVTHRQEREKVVLPQTQAAAEPQVHEEAQDLVLEVLVLEAVARAQEVVPVPEAAQVLEVVHEVQEDKKTQNNLHYEKNTNTPIYRGCIKLLCPNHRRY